MSVANGLGDIPSLTQTSLRTAACSTVSALRNGWSDQDMADEWGVSAGTVNNATNQNHDLSLMSFLRLGKRFRAAGVNTVLALIGLRATEADAVHIDVAGLPCELAGTLPLLIDLLRDGECSNGDVRQLEAAGAIESIVTIAEYLRQRRDAVRLRVAP